MDELDFSEITGEEVESDGTDNGSQNRTEFSQIHVKGRYGTELFKNNEGCRVCRRNSELLLLLGFVATGHGKEWDRAVQVCEHHEGDIRGDVEYRPEEIEVREF